MSSSVNKARADDGNLELADVKVLPADKPDADSELRQNDGLSAVNSRKRQKADLTSVPQVVSTHVLLRD